MATTDKASPRDRLLDAAAELFYRDGVSIGVEALCKSAGVSKWSTEPGFMGCPCLTALVELKDPEHPASVVARASKERMKEAFRVQAELGGAREPELLARQLMLIFDGANARAGA